MEKESKSFICNASGVRLDSFLRESIPGASRKSIRERCQSGNVEVNGRHERAGYLLKAGDTVQVLEVPESKATGARGELFEAQPADAEKPSIVFEDEFLIIGEKPRGIHSVVILESDPPTLADFLCHHLQGVKSPSPDQREFGLVHRLDYFTSGLFLAAKNPTVWRTLREMLQFGQIEKRYNVAAEGIVSEKSFSVDLPLISTGSGRKVKVAKSPNSPGAQSATTEIKVLKKHASERASLLQASAKIARRHQIRAHLSLVGYPLIGDELYGAKTKLQDYFPKDSTVQAPEVGFLLHAGFISFEHPVTKKLIEYNSQNPLLQALFKGQK